MLGQGAGKVYPAPGLQQGDGCRPGLLTCQSPVTPGPLPSLGEPPTGQRGSLCHGGGDGTGRGAAAGPAAGAGKAQPPGQCQVSCGLGTLVLMEPTSWTDQALRQGRDLREVKGFPGGAVVESLPANTGDTGSSPGLGRSHMPQSKWAREPQLLSLRVWSLCSATREAAVVRGPRTAMKSGPRLPQLEKALAQKRRPNTAINK